MARLTSKPRGNLASTDFALPRHRAYPINDIEHARMALAMVSKYGTDGEKSKVRREVEKKYPSLKKG